MMKNEENLGQSPHFPQHRTEMSDSRPIFHADFFASGLIIGENGLKMAKDISTRWNVLSEKLSGSH
jgi:hypothetical protein